MTASSFRTRRAALAACACAALAGVAAAPAAAQSEAWPSKPITLLVGYPPGGSTDLMARIVAPELARQLHATVVIENLGGAGGAIAAQKVANAPPDGHTLLVGANNELSVARFVNRSVRYTTASFTPIGLIASQPMVLVASPKASGTRDPAGFIREAKAHPGRYSYGTSGVGTALHLTAEMIKQQAGIFMTHIPYRGVAPLTTDLVGGNIEYGMFVLSSGLPMIRAGKVAAIGVTTAKRSPLLPDVPALAETPALRGLDMDSWFAVAGPARMPDAVAARLRKALADALQSPEVRTRLADASSTVADPSQDFARFWAAEDAKYRKIAEYAKITE
ncbi:MAG: tripartite tricarboxylate transporter substrate binding protein [Xylophilus ampelinus]